MKLRGILFTLALFSFITVFPAPTEARAEGNAALNLSRGRISGEKVDYAIDLPSFWFGYLSAERESQSAGGNLLEKIVFYYLPQDAKDEPVFLMNFYVYDKRRFKENAGICKLLETEDFVFACERAGENGLAGETDRALFGRFLSEAADAEYLAGFIRPPEGQKIILSNAVTVNGRKLAEKTVAMDGVVLVPLREACEALGYDVSWLPKEKAAAISMDFGSGQERGFYHLLLSTPPPLGRGFYTVIIEGRAYVPSLFFIQVLNANVEIDENYNVFINGS